MKNKMIVFGIVNMFLLMVLTSLTVVADDPPLIELDPSTPDGENGWYVTSVKVDFIFPEGTVEFDYSIDGTWWTYTSPVIINLGDGYHIIEAIAGLDTGEEIYDSVEFKVDTISPSIEISKERDPLRIIADVFDETSGINKVEFYLDGVLEFTDIDEPYEWIPGIEPSRDPHKIKAIAYDNAGNTQESNEITIRKSRSVFFNLLERFPLLLRLLNLFYF